MTKQSQTGTGTGKPRRPHHKSRMGCVQCKQRKVKCDEQKPICSKCEGYGTQCSFLQTHPIKRAVPTPASTATVQPKTATPESIPPSSIRDPSAYTPSLSNSTSPGSSFPTYNLSPQPQENFQFSMLDLELLHSWMTDGALATLGRPEDVPVFTTTVIQLALKHRFLMHQVLSLSALHLAHVRPQMASLYSNASDNHIATGLAMFQPEIANINPENCNACFSFSTQVFMQAWARQDVSKPSTLFFSPANYIEDPELGAVQWPVQWIKLHRGAMNVIDAAWGILSVGPLRCLFDDMVDLNPDRDDPLPEEIRPYVEALPESWIGGSTTIAQKEDLFKAFGKTKRIFSMLAFMPHIGNLHVAMSWFSWIPDGFLVMLENKVPEALLIVLYFCVALKDAEIVFWLEGKTANLMKTCLDVIGDGWERWTRWPVEQVLGPDWVIRENFPGMGLQ